MLSCPKELFTLSTSIQLRDSNNIAIYQYTNNVATVIQMNLMKLNSVQKKKKKQEEFEIPLFPD